MDVIVAHEKHGTFTYSSAYDLLKQRFEDGFWYDNWDDGDPAHQWEDRARAIVNFPRPKCMGTAYDRARAEAEQEALAFLEERADHEYEYIEVQAIR